MGFPAPCIAPQSPAAGLRTTDRGASCTGPTVFAAVVGCTWDHKLLREAVARPDLAAKRTSLVRGRQM
jgi:hypothetical protein